MIRSFERNHPIFGSVSDDRPSISQKGFLGRPALKVLVQFQTSVDHGKGHCATDWAHMVGRPVTHGGRQDVIQKIEKNSMSTRQRNGKIKRRKRRRPLWTTQWQRKWGGYFCPVDDASSCRRLPLSSDRRWLSETRCGGRCRRQLMAIRCTRATPTFALIVHTMGFASISGPRVVPKDKETLRGKT